MPHMTLAKKSRAQGIKCDFKTWMKGVIFIKKLKKFCRILLLITLSLVVMMAAPNISIAGEPPVPVPLGTTSTFAILAGERITNTGETWIGGSAGGDVGVHPGSEFAHIEADVTIENGKIYRGCEVALAAKNDLITAYDNAFGRPVPVNNTIPAELGGRTLKTGVYASEVGYFEITGTLRLDAENNPDAVFIFKTGSTLITADNSEIELINGAQYCRIFWQVGSSATLGTNSRFVGHIFALTSISAKTGARVQGQLLARNGEVTLESNTITNGICETTQPVLPTPEGPTLPTSKEPVALASAASLPKTGGYAVEALFGLGVLLTGTGIVIKKKSR